VNDLNTDSTGLNRSGPDSTDLSGELRRAGQEVATCFGSLPPHVYFAGSDEQWSPAHHVRHLTLSNRPLTQALRLAAPSRRVQPLTSQALTLTYLGEYEAAEASFQEALTLTSEGHGFRPTVLYGWSTLLRARGFWREAVESYETVVDLAGTGGHRN